MSLQSTSRSESARPGSAQPSPAKEVKDTTDSKDKSTLGNWLYVLEQALFDVGSIALFGNRLIVHFMQCFFFWVKFPNYLFLLLLLIIIVCLFCQQLYTNSILKFTNIKAEV